MFKKIKEFINERREYKEAKKALTLILLNQYSDFLSAETETKKAEKKAYDSMILFGDNFNLDDLTKLITDISTIVSNSKLTEDYYRQISKQSHEEKTAQSNVKVIK